MFLRTKPFYHFILLAFGAWGLTPLHADPAENNDIDNLLDGIIQEEAPAAAPQPAPAPRPSYTPPPSPAYTPPPPTYREDRSDLDPLIARMEALRCKSPVSAVQQTHLLTLLPMIRNGADVDTSLPQHKGNTALHYSCGIGSLSITRWLLAHGANPNATNHAGKTPIQDVAQDNHAAIIQELLKHGARQPQPVYQPSTSYADSRSDLDPLIARMAALRCKHAISALYQKRLLTLLPMIRNGADVDITLPETKGNTALHYSCAIGSLSITRWLLAHGANPNAVTHAGRTPMQCVGHDNRAAIIQALKAHGGQYYPPHD